MLEVFEQWEGLGGRVLNSRLRGCMFEPLLRHCCVLEQWEERSGSVVECLT